LGTFNEFCEQHGFVSNWHNPTHIKMGLLKGKIGW
jgi:hypothetical protein